MRDFRQPGSGERDRFDHVARTLATQNTMSLEATVRWLQAHRSPDPIQQRQTDAIVELHAFVKQIRQALSFVPPSPGAGAIGRAREAAEKGGTAERTTAEVGRRLR